VTLEGVTTLPEVTDDVVAGVEGVGAGVGTGVGTGVGEGVGVDELEPDTTISAQVVYMLAPLCQSHFHHKV